MEYKNNKSLEKAAGFLPKKISDSIYSLSTQTYNSITELRLHKNGCVGVVIDNQNHYLSPAGITADANYAYKTSANDIEDFLYNLCDGSVFIHENTIKNFYISIDNIRVGISGKAKYTDGKISTLSDITGLCIRLPRYIENFASELYGILMDKGFDDGAGVLISSKPGIGKTTLLKDLSVKLSSSNQKNKPYRVCVIDEREEIYDEKLFSSTHCDFLLGVDKIQGIETASRLLSPQIIICDELSGYDEALKICKIKSRGIVFICSVHADSPDGVLSKDYLKEMFDEKIFKGIYHLTKDGRNVTGKYTEVLKC